MSTFSHQSRSSKGFTLIELLVVMSIMLIVTTFLLFRQSKFNSSTLLRSLGYSVALSVRQAQVYGTSVLGTTTPPCLGGTYTGGVCYSKSYGIFFSAGTTYILFADLNNNGQYETIEAVKTFTLGSGYIISDFGATTIAASPVVQSLSGGTINSLTVLFTRPNPDACFATDVTLALTACQPGDLAATEHYSKGFVQIKSTGGDSTATRRINMSSTGQISVGNAGT